ncbi:MAG TPA: hypothetical protein VF950_20105 [Planctomycetota bacterium]
METNPIAAEAMKKIVAALMKVRTQAVAIGDAAHVAHGCARDIQNVDLLCNTGERYRLAILAAAKKEGLTPTEAPAGLLRLTYKTVSVRMLEAVSPFHRLVLSRAEPGVVLGVRSFVATPEDLILLRTASEAPSDKASVLELMRLKTGKLDADYLKAQAEAVGKFEKLKVLWKESQT